MSAADKLRELYAATPLDHRVIAIAEREAWDAFKGSSAGQIPKRDHWFRDTFGINPPTHAMFRAGILSHEPWAEPLWGLIGQFGLGRIYRICNDLRLDPNRDAVVQTLSADQDKVRGYRVTRRAAKTSECSSVGARDLRARLRELIKPFVDTELSELEEPGVASEIVSAFEIEVEAAMSDMRKRIAALRRQSGPRSVVATKIRDLRRACEFLGLKLPSRGVSIDMEQARRAHRKLSAQFHPDRTNSNEQMTSQYLEVQQAWEIVSSYQA
jgi:hypothetical protein